MVMELEVINFDIYEKPTFKNIIIKYIFVYNAVQRTKPITTYTSKKKLDQFAISGDSTMSGQRTGHVTPLDSAD